MAVYSRIKNWVSNEVLTAADLNAEFNNILTNAQPSGIEDYSADVSTMQSTTDPGGVGSESLATTLAGEIQRLRYAIKRIVGGAQWYSTPSFDLTNASIGTANIANNAVTTAKIADGNVTNAKIADGTINVGTKVTGTLAVANGGSGQTSGGTSGQAVVTNGTTWTYGSRSTIMQFTTGPNNQVAANESFFAAGNLTATAGEFPIRAGVTGKVTRLYYQSTATTSGTRTATLNINGVDTALTCSASGTSTQGSATGSVDVTAGDYMAIKINNSVGSNNIYSNATIVIDRTEIP